MRLLLDAHAFLWFCQDNPLLTATAKALIEDPANQKFVSVASCWEIEIKAGLGKLTLGEPSATYIPAALARTGFDLLAIIVRQPKDERRRGVLVLAGLGHREAVAS